MAREAPVRRGRKYASRPRADQMNGRVVNTGWMDQLMYVMSTNAAVRLETPRYSSMACAPVQIGVGNHLQAAWQAAGRVCSYLLSGWNEPHRPLLHACTRL